MASDAVSRLPIWERIRRSYKVCPVTGCFNWIRDRSMAGYGRISYLSKRIYAHRLVWTLHNGPIPRHLHVCHHCDNPRCVNPDHLFLGTNHDNIKDKQIKGRAAKKLTHQEIIEIRNDPRSSAQVAKSFKIDASMVRLIRSRKSWNHIN